MTSKIKTISDSREWKGPNGVVYYFNIEMENGDKGSIGKKSKDALKVGMELTYELKDGKIKEIKEQYQKKSYGRDYQKDFIGFAMSYAKDLIVADKVAIEDLPTYAEAIYKWMIEKLG